MPSPASPSTMPDPEFGRILARLAAMKVSENDPRKSPRLIPDILMRIFAEVAEGDMVHGGDRLESSPGHNATTMRSLSTVCRYWRDVAYSHPLLWNRIILSRGLCSRSVQAVNMHLRLSRDVPLFFTLEMVHCPCSPPPPSKWPGTIAEIVRFEMYEGLWSSMVGQQRRWKRVTIRCSQFVESVDRTWLLHNLPNAECLALSTPVVLGGNNNIPFSSLDLNNSVGLKTLDLQGDIRLCSIAPNVLDRLTTLTINRARSTQHFLRIPECLMVLSAAPNVEKLCVHPSYPPLSSNTEFPSLPHVVLAKLRMLEIGTHGERSVVASLLAQLTLPALLDLSIFNSSTDKPLDVEHQQSAEMSYGISALLDRSRIHLRSFKLSSSIEHESRVIEALQCMPHLRCLTLHACLTLSRNTLLALASVDDLKQLKLCPNLENLVLDCCDFQRGGSHRELIDAAAEMISERWFRADGKRTLKGVRARYCRLRGLESNDKIADIIRNGLNLYILDDDPLLEYESLIDW